MTEITPQLIVFLLAVGGFTLAAVVSDFKFYRIPNKLTLPVFVLGLIFQVAFNGWSGDGTLSGAGLKSSLLGFLVGFGTLFVLWLVGSGGGGDVKFMGALSVWLGFDLTLRVMIVSTVVILFATIGVMVFHIAWHGPRKVKRKYLATGKDGEEVKPTKAETVQEKQQRRIMAYATPVTVATWAVLLWGLNRMV